jgi:hypothetical protein
MPRPRVPPVKEYVGKVFLLFGAKAAGAASCFFAPLEARGCS